MTKWTARQHRPVLEEHAPVHHVAGTDVLGYRVIHESDRCDNLDLAAFHIGLINHATHPTEVVGVRIDHGNDRQVFDLLIDELQCCRRCLFRQ
jgi:hypothetical protein